LGIQAGQAQAQREAADRSQQVTLQMMQNAAAQRRLETEIQSRKELAEFNSWLSTESQKRAMAWEQEKLELSARHDFDMLQATKEVNFETELQKGIKEKQERERKLEALERALERKEITQEEYNIYRIRTEADQSTVPPAAGKDDLRNLFPPPPAAADTGGPTMTINGEAFYDSSAASTRPPVDQKAVQSEWEKIRPTAQKKAGVKSNPYATAIVEHLTVADLPDDEKQELRNIVKNNDPVEMKMAAEIIQAENLVKRQQESLTKSLTGAGVEDIPFAPAAYGQSKRDAFDLDVRYASKLVSNPAVSSEDRNKIAEAIESGSHKRLKQAMQEVQNKRTMKFDTERAVQDKSRLDKLRSPYYLQ
jgi:hypothetical protein